MNTTETQKSNKAQIEEVIAELASAERVQSEIEATAGEFESWYRQQKRNVIGYLVKHLEDQIDLAEKDLLESKKKIQIEMPSKETRTTLRERFHLRVVRALRFNFWGALSLLLLPAFFEFLDKVKYLSPMGPAIYPVIAVIFFILSLIFVIVRTVFTGRMRKKIEEIKNEVINELSETGQNGSAQIEAIAGQPQEKRLKKWPARRVFFWISSALALSGLIFFWPIAGIFAKIAIKSPFFPSAWQIILTALILFVIRFLLALLEYQRKFYAHYVEVQKVYEAVEWATTGSVSVQVAIRRFNFLKTQIDYWNRVLGNNLKKPWLIRKDSKSSQTEFMLGEAFPISVRVAEVIDETSDPEVRTTLRMLQNKVYQAVTRSGWRLQNFNDHFANEDFLANYTPRAQEIATALDRLNIGTTTELADEFEGLVKDDEFIQMVAEDLLEKTSSSFQKEILETSILKVKISRPYLVAQNKIEWDEHLKSILEDTASGKPLPNEYLQSWPFTRASISEFGLDSKVSTFVSAGRRIIEWIENQPKHQPSSNFKTEISKMDLDRKVDLVLRVDLVGLGDTPLKVEYLKIPTLIADKDIVLDVCPECQSSDCPAASDQTAACVEGDYFEMH